MFNKTDFNKDVFEFFEYKQEGNLYHSLFMKETSNTVKHFHDLKFGSV